MYFNYCISSFNPVQTITFYSLAIHCNCKGIANLANTVIKHTQLHACNYYCHKCAFIVNMFSWAFVGAICAYGLKFLQNKIFLLC